MTTIPDPDVQPKPGGLIREQGQPQEIQDLERLEEDRTSDPDRLDIGDEPDRERSR